MIIFRKLSIRVIFLMLFVLFSSTAWAVPMAEVSYLETPLAGGYFQYDYNVTNTTFPETNLDIYFLSLLFDSVVEATEVSLPVRDSVPTWESILPNDGTYLSVFSVDAWSKFPPDGEDIAPGVTLSGFSFIFNQQVEDIEFFADFAENGFPTGDAFWGVTTPVPEPSTILLLAIGIAGLGAFGRKKFRK